MDQLWRLTPQEYIALQREHKKREQASASYRESLVRMLVEAVYGSHGRHVTWTNGGGGARAGPGFAKAGDGFSAEEQRMLDDAARAFYGE